MKDDMDEPKETKSSESKGKNTVYFVAKSILVLIIFALIALVYLEVNNQVKKIAEMHEQNQNILK